MTEKRFTFIHFDWLQWHIYDNESLLCEVTDDEDAENLCKLLNELHDKNTRLKNEVTLLDMKLADKEKTFEKLHNMYVEAIKENKELKEEIRMLNELLGERELAEYRRKEYDEFWAKKKRIIGL